MKYVISALAAGATGFLCAFFWESIRGGRAQVETHWGGFGGGLGGWRISPSLLYLIGALAFAVLATVLSTTAVSEFKKTASQALVDKYQSAIRLMAQENVKGIQASVQGNRLTLKGEAPSPEAKNRIWDQIRLVNPALDDITVDVSLPAASPVKAAAPASK